ncbi:MAG: putative ATPase, partial [Pseudonocardiales bacterium]|nr:putative ATPase [Pseudonocardiales bacterium]
MSGPTNDGLFDIDIDSAASSAAAGAGSGSRPGSEPSATAPLAVRMRPRELSEVVGQGHLLTEGAPLRRLVEGA